jgi:hypothetical protein
MRSRVALVAVAAAAIGTIVAVANVRAWDLDVTDRGVPYVRLYDHPTTQLQAVLNQGDGQAFAALAQDPLLRRPEVFRAGSAEAAYRAQRPLLGWSAWATSVGQASLVPLMLMALSVAGFAALGAVLAWLLERRGGSVIWVLPVLLSPGALVTLDWTGPEALGTAAALLGLGLWTGERRRAAVVALVAAGLFRESLLLVPVAIAAHALLVDRRSWRSIVPLACPPVVYALWVGVVWLRLDALPSDAGQGRLGAPFAGLVKAADGWGGGDFAAALLIIGVGLGALVIGRRDPAGWVAGGFVLASFMFGSEVWRRSEDFGRLLLPVLAFGVLVLVPGLIRARSASPARLSPNISSGGCEGL